MELEPYPWRTNLDLVEVFALARPILKSLGVIEPVGGCAESDIAAAELRMQRPLPPDVRKFYRAMRPTELFAGKTPKQFGFYPIKSRELAWRSMRGAEPAEDWTDAQGLALGQSADGNVFWWVEKHRSIPDASIVLLDHEGSLGGEVMFVYFARSFREFIAKIAYFRNLYSAPSDLLFQREYVELNPSVKL